MLKITPYTKEIKLFKQVLAVVESELEMLSDAMEQVAKKDITPDEKILKLIETHLDSIKMVVYRNGTLRAGFFRNIWRVEAVRKNFYTKEIKLRRGNKVSLKKEKKYFLFIKYVL